MATPLRYEISDWHQLSSALSNNSSSLEIRVQDLINSDIITGLLIQVNHVDYGILFACVLNAHGTLITTTDGQITELTPTQIIAELYKYGFDIVYNPKAHLPSDQLDFLTSLLTFNYDKLRILNVWRMENGTKQFSWYVVAFNIAANPAWINNAYASNMDQFLEALRNGSAYNVSAIPIINQWSWTWLDYVANITDILADNA